MAQAFANPRQKTHEITFDLREVLYPWHRWFGRDIETRRASSMHYKNAYLCKLPETPSHTMLVEVPKWVFDSAECGSMRVEAVPHVDCATLRALNKLTVELRASLKPAVIQPQLSRQAGNGGIDVSDSNSPSDNAVGVIQRTDHPTELEQPRRIDSSRGGRSSRAAACQRSDSQSDFPGTGRTR
jgi:hypothetical protein